MTTKNKNIVNIVTHTVFHTFRTPFRASAIYSTTPTHRQTQPSVCARGNRRKFLAPSHSK